VKKVECCHPGEIPFGGIGNDARPDIATFLISKMPDTDI
jgi:hypothetical protein